MWKNRSLRVEALAPQGASERIKKIKYKFLCCVYRAYVRGNLGGGFQVPQVMRSRKYTRTGNPGGTMRELGGSLKKGREGI